MYRLIVNFLLKYWFLIIVILWGILIYTPTALLEYSLLDDGYSLERANLIYESVVESNWHKLQTTLLESDLGRVRPGYLLIQSALIYLSGQIPYINHLLRIAFLIISLILLYNLLKKIHIDYFWSVISIFYFFQNYQNYENYFRLGPVEPYLVILLLTGISLLLRGKNKLPRLATLLLVIAVFVKETFFLTSFCFLGWWLYLKYENFLDTGLRKNLLVTALTLLIAGGISFLIRDSYPESNNYASEFSIEATSIYIQAKNYLVQIFNMQSPFIFLSIWGVFVFLHRVLSRRKSDIAVNGLLLFFLLLLVGNFIILLPWPHVLGRYLILVNLGLVVFMGYGGARLDEQLRSYSLNKEFLQGISLDIAARIVVLFMAALAFLPNNFFNIANFQHFHDIDIQFSTSINDTLSELPSDTEIWVNYKKGTDNVEIYKGAEWLLTYLYNREDLNFSYIDEANLCTDHERYILDRNSVRFTSTEDIAEVSEVVMSRTFYYEPVVQQKVLRSFWLGYKVGGWSTSNEFTWTLFRQRENTCLTINNYE